MNRRLLWAAALLMILPGGTALAQVPAEDRTLTVQDVNCNQVTIHGTGWEPTEATVEFAIPPTFEETAREDYLVIEQVFPTGDNVIHATIPVPDKPGGRFIVQVLVDNQPMDPRTEPFTIPLCQETGPEEQLPFTGTGLGTVQALLAGIVLVLAGAVFLLINRRRL